MEYQEIANLISLAATIPTIYIAVLVLCIFGRDAISNFCMFNSRKMESIDWLMLGITVSFAGQFADNLYWQIPWTASFLELEVTQRLVDSGVFFNIFSRQAAGIVAGYCHLHAYYTEKASAKNGNCANDHTRSVLIASLVGMVYALSLVIIRDGS